MLANPSHSDRSTSLGKRPSGWVGAEPGFLRFFGLVGILLLLGWYSARTVSQAEVSLMASTASKLETILQIETEAIKQWVESRTQIAKLLAMELEAAPIWSSNAPPSPQLLAEKLSEISRQTGGQRHVVTSVEGTLQASSAHGEQELCRLLAQVPEHVRDRSQATMSPILPVPTGSSLGSNAVVIVFSPIRPAGRPVVGFLGMVVDLEKELTRVLASSRSGVTVETIAIDEEGYLLSRSRFPEAGQRIPGWENHSRDLQWEPSISFADDHRGVPVAWAARSLATPGLNLLSKMDLAEIRRPIAQIRRFIWTMFLLVLTTTVLTLFYRWYVYKLRQVAQHSELDRQKVGAYELEKKIGEGGMGIVYRANHKLLRRPTAIKVLPPEKSGQASIARFEREVRFTSQLKHPNTISIYDYGWTETGMFYYAMELLEGCNLESLVQLNGPLNDGRVVYILRQVCHSLREAHAQGLVHGDIKPANIMLCDRGGACDLVKVLDFGMVRHRQDGALDGSVSVAGTPLYMAPECFSASGSFDQRVDVFSLGAVAFYLSTGESLLQANHLQDLFQCHRRDIAVEARRRLQQVSEERFSPELKTIIAACVVSRPHQRVAGVTELLQLLEGVRPKIPWGSAEATRWWETHAGQLLEVDHKLGRKPRDAMVLTDTQPFVEWSRHTTSIAI